MKIDILWSKGYKITNNYALQHTEHISKKENIIHEIDNSDNIIWIRNGSHNLNRISDLDIFSSNLHLLKKPIILLTTDGDRSVPSSYNENTINKILNHKYIKKWYTQNYDKTIIHKKLTHFPIGLDLHTSKWLINNSIKSKI